jgi:hypothetical protein
LSLRDVLEGIDNFLISIEFNSKTIKPIQRMIKKEIIKSLSNKDHVLDFKKLKQVLMEHKREKMNPAR